MDNLLKFLLHVLAATTGIIMAYFIIRAVTKDKKQFVNKFFKGLAILFVGAVAITGLANISLFNEPDAIEPAVAYVKENPQINNLIGEYKGYSYNKYNIPDNSQKYGFYNFTVNGSQADLSLDCYVYRNNKGGWHITKIANQQLLEKN